MAHHDSPSDERLMARYQRRLDDGAFGQLVARYMAPALGVARQLLPDRALAEDAVQEAFLRLVRRRERYDPTRPFAPWFYAILRNVCTDVLRRQARAAQAVQEAGHERARREGGIAPSGEALALLGQLGADDQAVLVLRVVQGLAFGEVAAALGISEEAAKKRAQRALRRLREAAREGEWAADDTQAIPGNLSPRERAERIRMGDKWERRRP
ncbi:MAG TPA: sigma-70 family RNA polymerase sigma factor [Planctomycetota bacterium]|nr:sigma-70 family RNA polymerase sigma factor [Planctomycetota bacterium]